MISRLNFGVLATLAAAVFFLCGFSGSNPSQANRSRVAVPADPILVTAAPAYEPLADIAHGKERFPEGAHLLIFHAAHSESLLPEFFASADANVSFDGTTVLFSGKKNANDPWQIWELTLADHTTRKLVFADTDLIRPFYLPGYRIAYAKRTSSGFQIETASDEGNDKQQLTYISSSAVPVDVMQDGRILFESGFPLGTAGTPELYLVYPDGSGVESYRCDHGHARWGGHQLVSGPHAGDVIITHGRSLGRFTSPLATEVAIAAPAAEYDGSLAETPSGAWFLTARANGNSRFGVMLLRPGAAALQPFFSSRDNHLIEPVVVAPRTVPKRHPTGLHEWTTANLLALDVRRSRDGKLDATPTAVRLEAQDDTGNIVTMGFAPIEADGSFYVKTPADRPIHFVLLDRNGVTLRAERGWFWIRKGEQRICVGCHAGPEQAPENRVPQVLLRTTVPVDLSGATSVTAAGGH